MICTISTKKICISTVDTIYLQDTHDTIRYKIHTIHHALYVGRYSIGQALEQHKTHSTLNTNHNKTLWLLSIACSVREAKRSERKRLIHDWLTYDTPRPEFILEIARGAKWRFGKSAASFSLSLSLSKQSKSINPHYLIKIKIKAVQWMGLIQ